MDIVLYTEFLIKSICKDPEMVKVQSYQGEDNITILDVLVPENSMGAVIGMKGRNAKSIRTLVQAYAYVNNLGYVKLNIEAF